MVSSPSVSECPTPTAAEELLSSEKDVSRSNWLSSECADLVLELLGPSRWLRLRPAVEATAQFAYFALQSAGGRQTLGEEYCNLVQVADQGSRFHCKLCATIQQQQEQHGSRNNNNNNLQKAESNKNLLLTLTGIRWATGGSFSSEDAGGDSALLLRATRIFPRYFEGRGRTEEATVVNIRRPERGGDGDHPGWVGLHQGDGAAAAEAEHGSTLPWPRPGASQQEDLWTEVRVDVGWRRNEWDSQNPRHRHPHQRGHDRVVQRQAGTGRRPGRAPRQAPRRATASGTGPERTGLSASSSALSALLGSPA